MNWLLRKLGYRDSTYRDDDFSVRVEPMQREAVSVTYTRSGARLYLDAERIGNRWEGIQVYIPERIETATANQIARDLAKAFEAMKYGFVIGRLLEVEVVPENERQAAISELREMGYEVDVLPDKNQVQLKRRAQTPLPSLPSARAQGPHVMELVQVIQGKRKRWEVLAKSVDGQS